jgi:hypothetical protein
MRANTITTQARVGARGRMKRRIVPGAILALSLAVALLAATASSASYAPGGTSYPAATWVCPLPSSPTTDYVSRCGGLIINERFDFGYHLVGTSTSQQFELGVRGVTGGNTFNPRIGVSGEYAQTNNCPPTLSAGTYQQILSCLITVTFTPTGERTGPRPGTLTTGPGGPTMALTGNGEARDSVPPDLRLSGPKKQSPQKGPQDAKICDDGLCDLQVKASCGDRWCTARATGRLTNVNKDKLSPAVAWDPRPPQGYGTPAAEYRYPGITPGKRLETGPELRNDRQRKQVRQALAEGKTVKAKVTVKATDTSGNVATAKRTITLVK